MALAPAFAELSQLRQSLGRLNYAGEVSDMVLFPGQQRWTLIKWLMKGLLCGREVESITVPGLDDRDMSLPEQERLAARCVHLLAALGVRTTLDEVQGCCAEHLRCKLLTRLAQLLSAALPFQAAILTRSTSAAAATTGQQASQQQQAPAEAWLERSLGLLEWAVGAKGHLLQDHATLFPADLTAAADRYRDAAPLLPQLQEALVTQLQRVQAEVLQLQEACGGRTPLACSPSSSQACDASGGRPDGNPGTSTPATASTSSSQPALFPQLLPDTDSSTGASRDQSSAGSGSSSMGQIGQQLQQLLGQLQELSGMYDERLSVWAREEAAAASGSGPGSSSSEALDQDMGAAAARVDGLYQQVVQLLRVVGSLQGHYTAISQKLPRAFLQQVTEQHRQEAESLAACCQALGAA